ncbi:MAG: hypothetical protein OES46_02945 [Gammaproteobacteria bacterium]|jgi:hypothetical protein|nr:hypothetical protein [Gammaproteobacteria bacterium]
MAVQLPPTATNSNVLRRALQANGLFSAVNGVVLAVLPTQVSSFLGLDMPGLMNFLGAGLIGFAVALFWLAAEPRIRRSLALAVILLDVAWVVDSILLLVTDIVPLTIHGMWAIAIVSGMVASLAALQSYGLRRSYDTPQPVASRA